MNKYDNIPENKAVYEKGNHSFLVTKHSIAEQNIQKIIDVHFNAYQEIKKYFSIEDFKIFYNIFDNPIDCAKAEWEKYPSLFKNNELYPINAWARYPDNINFTFSNDIKAIGYHEIVHLVTYKYFGFKSIQFLNEGIAVFFDDSWKGDDLHRLTNKQMKIEKIENILNDNIFDNMDNNISYPLAGSFCKWLIEKYTINNFIKVYKQTRNNEFNDLEKYYKEYLSFIR